MLCSLSSSMENLVKLINLVICSLYLNLLFYFKRS